MLIKSIKFWLEIILNKGIPLGLIIILIFFRYGILWKGI